jgi:hypothetical protein
MAYEGVSKSFRTDRLERELQMVQLSATTCSCIAILWVSLVSLAKSSRTESITKYMLITINTRWEATQRVTAANLTRLTHKIAIQLQLMAESCTICSSRSRRPVRKLLDTPSYTNQATGWTTRVQSSAGAMMVVLLFTTASRPATGTTQPPIQRVPWTLTPE